MVLSLKRARFRVSWKNLKEMEMALYKTILILGTCILAFASGSAANAADSLTDVQKQEIRDLIKSYLQENPDIIIDAAQNYQRKKEEDMRAAVEGKVGDYKDELTGKDQPSAGNPGGDVTVTEFFDYNCGYCKHAVADIKKILENDKNVFFVFKELPILGPTSETAAQWSMAAHKQGKYFDYHAALMGNNEPRTEENLIKVAKEAGLDADKLKQDAQSEETRKAVAKSRDVAMDLEIHGTPAFIINGKLFPGYLGEEGLKKAIEEIRKNPKP